MRMANSSSSQTLTQKHQPKLLSKVVPATRASVFVQWRDASNTDCAQYPSAQVASSSSAITVLLCTMRRWMRFSSTPAHSSRTSQLDAWLTSSRLRSKASHGRCSTRLQATQQSRSRASRRWSSSTSRTTTATTCSTRLVSHSLCKVCAAWFLVLVGVHMRLGST